MAWPTMREANQYWEAVGSYYRHDDVTATVADVGRLVLVRFEIEAKGEYAGEAVRCWVEKRQVATVDKDRAADMRTLITTMRGQGVSATCRGRFARSESDPHLWLFGLPEPRGKDDPFLPPMTNTEAELAPEETERLGAQLPEGRQAETQLKVGTLANFNGQTWLSMDGVWSGALPGAPREYVDAVLAAGFPATCWVEIHRSVKKVITAKAGVPDDWR